MAKCEKFSNALTLQVDHSVHFLRSTHGGLLPRPLLVELGDCEVNGLNGLGSANGVATGVVAMGEDVTTSTSFIPQVSPSCSSSSTSLLYPKLSPSSSSKLMLGSIGSILLRYRMWSHPFDFQTLYPVASSHRARRARVLSF